MSALIVLLPNGPAGTGSEFTYAVSTDRRSIERHGSAPAALLPIPRGAAAEVVAVAPVQALSWHRVELPKGVAAGSPRLRGVLEGLLEERLLDEPEALHFALAPTASGATWVATCDRAWLRAAVQALESAGRAPGRIVPEFSPQEAPALHAVGTPESPTLVWAGPDAVLLLPLASSSLGLLPALTEDTPVLAEPAVAAQAEQVLQRKVELQQAPQRWLAAAQGGWDLAQFEFASSARARALKRLASGASELLRAPVWRPLRWGAVALLVVHLLGVNVWAWQERSALQAKREAVRRTLTETFPKVQAVVDAPVQMEREVAALRQLAGSASGRDLETMLSALGTAAPAGRSAASLEFNGNELRVQGLGLNPDELTSVITRLKGLGYAARMQAEVLVIAPEAGP